MFKLFVFFFAAIFLSPRVLAQSVEKQLNTFKVAEHKIVAEFKTYQELSTALSQVYFALGFREIAARKDKLSAEELDQLFEAQFILSFYSKDGSHLPLLEATFAELITREKVERKHVRKLYEQYIKERQFDGAAALVEKYPTFNLEPLPTISAHDSESKHPRAIWLIDKTEKRLTRKALGFAPDWQLVAISHPLCHFSKNALTYIKNDTALAKSLEGHFTLIGPQDDNLQFDVMQKWNIENPLMPIHPVDQQIAFPEFDRWSTPIFYFMKAGKVVYKFNGWPKEGNRTLLDEGLRIVGAISGEKIQKK